MSDRAVKLLMQRSKRNGERINYDLYSEFGCSLGTDPSVKDDELNSLSVACCLCQAASLSFRHKS